MANLALVHEAIAAAVPDRECLVFGDRRLRWGEINDRTRRLAAVLRGAGLGCRVERDALQGWESGQDHVALYLYNGNEYLEGMLGAYKSRTVPVNVNYRYVDDELVYLLQDSRARAVIFHSTFAPVLARIRARLPRVTLWLQVADDSGEPLLEGAHEYEQALREAAPEPPDPGCCDDDLYILYTGGTTGAPKGVLWRQDDIFRAALYRAPFSSLDEIVERAVGERNAGIRALPAAPFMHGAAHWAAFTMWFVGGTVVVQSEPRRLDARSIWSAVEKERVNAITIVGDAFGRALLDELLRSSYDLSSLQLLISGGAILTASLKRELLEHLPHVRINDALGSSESGVQASQSTTRESEPSTGDFELDPQSLVLSGDLRRVLRPGSDEEGWLARRGPMPLGYLGDPEKTARTFPVIDGVRYAVPGDRARLDADGSLRLLGRDSVTINTGGEKVFAEEVEQALKHHPDVHDAVVVGTPHERWGQQVTAVVRWREGARPDEDAVRVALHEHLADYKVPKVFVAVDELVRSPSGKADYRWARATALERLGGG